MDHKQLLKIGNNMAHLMSLHKKQDEILRQLIFAIVHKYIKENNIIKTDDEWSLTKAAVKMWMGETDKFIVENRIFVPRRHWPTHLRLLDLKPVYLKECIDESKRECPDEFKKLLAVYDIRGKQIGIVSPSIVEENYIRIRENNNE